MPRQMNQIELSVIIFQDEQQVWCAQGLEYDISAYADKLKDIPEKFALKVFSEVAVCLDLGRQPLDGIEAAPKEYWDMFSAASMTVNQEVPPVRWTDSSVQPRFVPKMKVGEKLAA